MAPDDVANIELLGEQELADAVGMVLDCAALQTAANDLACRWTLGPIDPELCDVSEPSGWAVPPYKAAERDAAPQPRHKRR
ncbi:MAG: hypothetical protein DCC67_11470 [Planctomycetota bacterium]|nr:MAG: hypothetical protein DCC67_11470 [Planctomycetota bacterium]